MRRYFRHQVLAPTLSGGLLLAMGLSALSRPTPQDAESYHEQVRLAAASIPHQIGDWMGTDKAITPAAIKILQPNAMLNRSYKNAKDGRTASVLLVQCKNARDLAGHYPPNCYPSHGWKTDNAEEKEWRVDGHKMRGMEYAFSFARTTGTSRIVIRNFMILPNGQIYPDMNGVRMAAADYNRYFFGAAQFQLLTEAGIPNEKRDSIFRELLSGYEHVIEVIRGGQNK